LKAISAMNDIPIYEQPLTAEDLYGVVVSRNGSRRPGRIGDDARVPRRDFGER